jgi:hypothetical protein
MLCLVAAVVDQQRWPRLLPCGSTWWAIGWSPRLADLLGRDLVVHPASQTCSTVAWSFAPPHRLARRGLGHSPRLVGLLSADLVVRPASQTCSRGGGELVGKWAKERFMGLTLGTPFLGTRHQPPSLCAAPWSRSEAFLPGVASPECAQAHQYDLAPEQSVRIAWGFT